MIPQMMNQGNQTNTASLNKRKAIAMALNPPQDLGSGLQSLGQAFAMRAQQQNANYPAAPGGAKPSFFTTMQNLFGGNQGGIY